MEYTYVGLHQEPCYRRENRAMPL